MHLVGWLHFLISEKWLIQETSYGTQQSTLFSSPELHALGLSSMRAVAQREGVPVIELHDMTRDFFETLGFEGSKRALVHYPANTFPGQDSRDESPVSSYE